MSADDGTGGEPQGDAAERAFVALRDDVAALRQAVQAALADQAATAPDYGPTLGAMARELQGITQRLATIEAHPALRLSPEQHARALADAGTAPLRDAASRLDRAAREAEHDRRQLAATIGTARRQDAQHRWLLGTGLAAFVAGLLALPILAGLLPFGLDRRIAALVMHADRWHAGSALMQDASPASWRDLVTAADLARANEATLKACREAAARTKKEQRCAVTVPAP